MPERRHQPREEPRDRLPQTAPGAAVAALHRAAGNRAIADAFARCTGWPPGPRVIQRDDRETNPRPSVAESKGSVALAEHHVVPYETLQQFAERARADGKTENLREVLARFVPHWKDVSVAELLRLNEVSNVKDRSNPFSDPMYAEDERAMKAHEVLASERRETLVTTTTGTHRVAEPSEQTQRWLELDKALKKYRQLNEGLPSPLHDLNYNYFYWNPGNLFVGPEGAIRAWDPKNKFDAWAKYFMVPDHYVLLERLYANMRKYIDNGTKLGLVSRGLRELSMYGTKTPYRAAEWALVAGKYKPARM